MDDGDEEEEDGGVDVDGDWGCSAVVDSIGSCPASCIVYEGCI